MTNDEILSLAKEQGGFGSGEEFVLSFYKSAFNAGLEAAAKAAENAPIKTSRRERSEASALIDGLDRTLTTKKGNTMSNDPWIHRSDNMKCKTCMWFVPKVAATHPLHDNKHNDTNTYDLGRCRRHAPSMGGYPVVMVNDWCGDHRLDENKFRAG